MRSPQLTLCLGVVSLLALAAPSPWLRAADEPANLLVNGDFALQDEPTKPTNWQAEQIQKIEISTTEKPDGVNQALKVEITTDQVTTPQGWIGQEVKVEPGKFYKVSGTITATTDRLGFLQVKLREGKNEGDRVYTEFGDGDWKEVSKVFSSKNSDNLLVMCRFNQKTTQIGQTCGFANIKLTEATAEEAAAAASEAPTEQ